MPLYTIVADYRGGTYSSQHRARSPRAALSKWLGDDTSSKYVHRGRRATRERLVRGLLDPKGQPMLLDGLVQVWCTTVLVAGTVLLVNIVETAE